jgi:hypothetical protein
MLACSSHCLVSSFDFRHLFAENHFEGVNNIRITILLRRLQVTVLSFSSEELFTLLA